MRRKKIKDIFPNVLSTGAVLTAIKNAYPTYLSDIGLTDSDIRAFDIYYISKSGERSISNLLKLLSDSNRLTLVTDDGQRLIVDNNANLVGVKGLITLDSDSLAEVISDMFKDKWTHLFRTYNWTYDPTKPFIMTVKDNRSENRTSENTNESSATSSNTTSSTNTNESSGTENVKGSGSTSKDISDKTESSTNSTTSNTGKVTDDGSTTGSVTKSGSDESTTVVNGANTVENKVAAFDATEYQKDNYREESSHSETGVTDQTSETSTSSGTTSNTKDTTESGTSATSSTDNKTVGETGSSSLTNDTTKSSTWGGTSTDKSDGNRSSTWGGTATGSNSSERTTEREGNIGNISTQELLEKERQLYLKTFFEYVKYDLDRVLTIPIYEY